MIINTINIGVLPHLLNGNLTSLVVDRNMLTGECYLILFVRIVAFLFLNGLWLYVLGTIPSVFPVSLNTLKIGENSLVGKCCLLWMLLYIGISLVFCM